MTAYFLKNFKTFFSFVLAQLQLIAKINKKRTMVKERESVCESVCACVRLRCSCVWERETERE